MFNWVKLVKNIKRLREDTIADVNFFWHVVTKKLPGNVTRLWNLLGQFQWTII